MTWGVYMYTCTYSYTMTILTTGTSKDAVITQHKSQRHISQRKLSIHLRRYFILYIHVHVHVHVYPGIVLYQPTTEEVYMQGSI